MAAFPVQALLPELTLVLGFVALFIITLGERRERLARAASLVIALVALVAAIVCLQSQALLFDGVYRIDAFSQWLKAALIGGYGLVVLLTRDLPDIRSDIRSEYYLFLGLSVTGLCILVSSVEIITLLVALELSSFPLYLLVPMRRERAGQKAQMESAIKYIMFGIAANGIMFFGLSYLYGLTGTTFLPVMIGKLQPLLNSPVAIIGLAMTFAGLYFKLAVFPFHFWTPDVYQGAANETAAMIASLPKIGAVAVLVRLVSLATPDARLIVTLIGGLAIASMFYGNLIALAQTDFKRLLGFSGIAHAGYALLGFVALDTAGFTAALYYIVAYALMVLACFVVITRVSADGQNIPLSALAGLHRRSPLLALTLVVGVFSLAGIPPFAGFMGKLSLLTAALNAGHLILVILAVINSAIAVYYYLCVVREACFREAPESLAPIPLDRGTSLLCLLLIVGILALGVTPATLLDAISSSLAGGALSSAPPVTAAAATLLP